MSSLRRSAQPDLFGPGPVTPDLFSEPDAPDSALLARHRLELAASLAALREATAYPWADLTTGALAELRFLSLTGMLPPAERAPLREAHAVELDRVNALWCPSPR
ncbi:hypothetical protein C8P66_11164 [Humitalea rosea]|uniref:Uncharacterized protein n=1 Tax=Humitalea rosea TaxID=990373 RepID=A0A2W7J234_9PROT|nr:hypothetical protein [Humitalea rosea]PZW45649.1 hypothetical protein C8P66_11164 [Humitalea rosea]